MHPGSSLRLECDRDTDVWAIHKDAANCKPRRQIAAALLASPSTDVSSSASQLAALWTEKLNLITLLINLCFSSLFFS